MKTVPSQNWSGLHHHPGRAQPWSIWYCGEIVGFAETRRAAEVVYGEELKRRGAWPETPQERFCGRMCRCK